MLDPREQGWEHGAGADEFAALVGPLLSRTVKGETEYAFQADRKHLSRYNRVHGGMLMWLCDKALGMNAWEAAGRPEKFAFMAGRLLAGDKVVASASGVWKYR